MTSAGSAWSRPSGETGRITTRSPYHLLPNSHQIKGVNLAVSLFDKTGGGPDNMIWTRQWTNWDWAGSLKPRCDLAKHAGANTVRMVGSVQAVLGGYITRATYLARWAQLIEYCDSIGLFVYACSCDGYASGYDNFATYSASNPTGVVNEIAALAALLDTYGNVVGLDVWNEAPDHTLRSTAAAAVRAVTDIPITFSTFSNTVSDTEYRSSIAVDVDFYDYHIYNYSYISNLEAGYWGSGATKPILFGEFGTPASGGDPTSNWTAIRNTLTQSSRGNTQVAGACVWALQDYDTVSSNQYGLFLANGAERTPNVTIFRTFPL